jgi:hypothetical protein
MRILLLYIIAFIIPISSLTFADIFSPFDKYSLDYSCLENQSRQLADTTHSFFSLPGLWSENENRQFLLRITTDTLQHLDIYGHLTGGIDTKGSEVAPLVAIGSKVRYQSKYIVGLVDFNIYTIDTVAGTTYSMHSYERFVSGNEPPINGLFNFDFNLAQAFLNLKLGNFELLTGKQKLRWGPGYKGTLGLSGTNYSVFYFYHAKLHFSKRIIFQSFLSGYDDDPWFRTKDYTEISARYGAGQRMDWIINRHLQIGLYELCNFSGDKELVRYANPLQIYYFAQNTGASQANLLGGADFNLLIRNLRIYGEILNDDITIFDKRGNPNKYGFQLGNAFLFNRWLYLAGVEYNHIAQYVYGNSYGSQSLHAFWGSSMGWPWGNEQDLFTLYTLFKPTQKLDAKVEFNYWVKGNGKITDDWEHDGQPDLDQAAYWPVRCDHIFNITIAGRWKPSQWLTADLTISPYFVNLDPQINLFGYLMVEIPGNKTIKIR